ncbi:MAG: hypothetical protein ACE5E9_12955 [Nitrospinaceae bacterium]
MDPFESYLDKEYEQLNEAIMKAIVSSEEVKKVLMHFKSKDLINNLAVLNLILSLEELSELVFSRDDSFKLEPVDGESPSQVSGGDPEPSDTTHDKIDGKNLTRNEVLFEKFFQGVFDEKKWMKKAGIRL